jgi:hypothetical protein
MHKGSFVLAILTVFAVECRPQVLSPPEIVDPAMSALQQRHFPELKAAGVEITSHQYPFRFYLSRTLDLTEKQEQQTDQRSIRFADFQGQTVLQVTGNYFAAYSNETMSRNERVRRTYLDVVLPILRATASRVGAEPQLTAFAIEISHHVRKQVLGVTVENPENLAIIIPRATAAKVAASTNENEQVTALLESRIFIDGKAVTLWPQQGMTEAENAEPSIQPASPQATPRVVNASAILAPTPSPAPNPASAVAPQPARDISTAALRLQQSAYQSLFDGLVRSLDGDAHFVSYAPPVLVAFHEMSYLQLSITTNLAPHDAGSQYRVAALAFDRHVSRLIRPVLAMLPKDSEFDGIVFSSSARIGNASDSGASQSVEFFLPLSELRRFEKYDVTGQQLINSGFVLINGERVGLELQSAEADIR